MTDVTITDLAPRLEDHRRELTTHCSRMLGSGFEAEDAVQETLMRAWRSYDGFEGRSSLRAWLYRIATNVCLDVLQGRQRRPVSVDLASPRSGAEAIHPEHTAGAWSEPADDPAERVVSREAVRLAFVVALQLLPPRQRAVLILREVLRWPASEVAELLDTSVASVNSSLQRARATLASTATSAGDRADPENGERLALLPRYVDAFERLDVDQLVTLIRADSGKDPALARNQPQRLRKPDRRRCSLRA
jgi:RNA polymerase sigma-70 factor (ECF subfamily)